MFQSNTDSITNQSQYRPELPSKTSCNHFNRTLNKILEKEYRHLHEQYQKQTTTTTSTTTAKNRRDNPSQSTINIVQ